MHYTSCLEEIIFKSSIIVNKLIIAGQCYLYVGRLCSEINSLAAYDEGG